MHAVPEFRKLTGFPDGLNGLPEEQSNPPEIQIVCCFAQECRAIAGSRGNRGGVCRQSLFNGIKQAL